MRRVGQKDRIGPRRSARAAVVAMAFAAVLAAPAGAAASPEDVFGFGVRSSAMGATGTASAEGYEAVYSNPALLSLARSKELTVGMTGAFFDLEAKTSLAYEPLRGSIIGAVVPIPFEGPLRHRIAFGLGFFTPFDLVVRGRLLYADTPEFPVADRTQSVAVQAGIGVDVTHGVRIGGGFAALAALSGNVDVATDTSGRIGTVVSDTLVASYGPILGASVDLGENYRVGLAYRGTLVGQFNVVINVHDLGSIVVPPLNISGIAQYDPWQIALEVARVRGPWRAAIGGVFKKWSEYPGALEATVQCPVVDPVLLQPFAGECKAKPPPPPNYSDTVSPHAGVERVFVTGDVVQALRAGAFFEMSPAPEQTTSSNKYDNARVGESIGYGIELRRPLPPIRLDLFLQAQELVPRTNVKDASVPKSNAGYPSVHTSGFIGAAGASAGVKF